MRKTLVFVTILVFICALSLSAAPINVFANAGIAFSDIEGLFFDVGAEMQLSGPIWGQVSFDYYLNPMDDVEGIDSSVYGINLYGVYKKEMNDKMNIFGKAGVHLTTAKVSGTFMGIDFSASDTDFGIGGGAGIEYKLADKMFLLAGATMKMLFAEGDTANWFKIYGGFCYQVGK